MRRQLRRRGRGSALLGLLALGGFFYGVEALLHPPLWAYAAGLGALLLGGVLLLLGSRPRRATLHAIDKMSGVEFERCVARLLRREGFSAIELTAATGDYGADVVARRGKERYIFQCKRYGRNVGVTPVQEIHAAASHYGSDVEVVVTNQYFTPNACVLAEETGVLLWDRDDLAAMLRGARRESIDPGKLPEVREEENDI